MIEQFAVTAAPYMECVAVSTSADAMGTCNRYAFSYGSQFPDYPKIGVWPDAYYVTFNQFLNGVLFTGALTCAYDRAAMLAGTAAAQQCFTLPSNASLMPSDLDGAILPPAGSPNFQLTLAPPNALKLFKFHVDWTTPANTTLTGPITIAVPSYTEASGDASVPQPGTTQKLDSLGDRLMFRLAYRRFADGHEAMVTNHTVVAGTRFAPRWYEIRSPNATPTLFQSGTYAPADTIYRWMGSIAMDKLGDIAIGYSASSSTVFPSIRFTGRVPADPIGTLQAEKVGKAGAGSQQTTLSRWGDYSSMSIDPTRDCLFAYNNEYLKVSGTFNWSTWIDAIQFPGCS